MTCSCSSLLSLWESILQWIVKCSFDFAIYYISFKHFNIYFTQVHLKTLLINSFYLDDATVTKITQDEVNINRYFFVMNNSTNTIIEMLTSLYNNWKWTFSIMSDIILQIFPELWLWSSIFYFTFPEQVEPTNISWNVIMIQHILFYISWISWTNKLS